ncbi:hypothetical protein GCM10022251_16910 [Phytohabitans flavus]|uniref:Protein-glutamine gamma-glutamyltransferase-like C-terminal domain-containing protein n=1 Tax=Phytohabitans flavus TaxID=1076124 RepID=A0A6F8Y661_9ACTN|nr:DUF4129 domain-containing protein [Phytohabitans flavus]BCB81550.1 hypothetical protein Pflav_079600 [Phytohabitans flavus]
MTLGSLRRLWPLAAVVLLLALATVAAAHSSPQIGRVDEPAAGIDGPRPQLEEVEVQTPQTPEDFVDTDPAEVPAWLGKAALVLGAIVLAVLLAVMIWTLAREFTRRRAGGKMPPRQLSRTASAEEVVAALDAGLIDLSDADLDPRRAVIACWLRLEQAAAAAGTPRQATDTPTDLVSRLLGEHNVSRDVLAGFADVYREARYATHTVDERMREQARTALQRLRAELTAGVKP